MPNPLEPLDPNITRSSPTRKADDKPLERTRASTGSPLSDGLTSEPVELINPVNRPSLTIQPSFQHSRKRLTWRNKVCYILLPHQNESGQRTNRASYLKHEEVEQRLRVWQEKGFNTRGFTLDRSSSGTPTLVSQGQSRAVHPDPDDDGRECSNHSYRVSIPDKQAWDTYVRNLQEERLRNLGVTSSDDEPPSRKSPAPSLMSREASSQSSALLTSPPLQPTSGLTKPFVPGYHLASAQGGKPGVSHFPRYSIAMPVGEKAMHNHAQFTSSLSPTHRNISPLAYLSSASNSRIGSPSINEQLASQFNASLTNETPRSLPNSSQQAMNEVHDPIYGQRHPSPLQTGQPHRQIQGTSQLTGRPQNTSFRRDNSTLNVDQAQLDERIATPIPRNHRQNPSKNLQRDIDLAEAQLGNTNDHSGASDEPLTSERVALSASDDHRKFDDDFKSYVQKEISNVKLITASTKQEDQHAVQSFVISKLNVNAPEFKLEPKQPDSADVVHFQSSQQAVKQPQSDFQSSNVPVPHTRKASATRPLPKLNAAAPAFTPGTPIVPKPSVASRVFSFGNEPSSQVDAKIKPSTGSREFSFSSKAPSFNPDAPAFTPSNQTDNESSASKSEPPKMSRIFSDVDFSDIVKPSDAAKAVPIVKPRSIDEGVDETESPEDEYGRITQSIARQKRMRRDQDDSDQVPQFATPTNDIASNALQTTSASASPMKKSTSKVAKPTSAEAATSLLVGLVNDMSASPPSDSAGENDNLYDGNHHSRSAQSLHQSQTGTRTRHLSHPSDFDELPARFATKSGQSSLEPHEGRDHGIPRSRMSRSVSYDDRPVKSSGHDRDEIIREGSQLRQDILDGMRHVEPPFDELDEVMKCLNQNDDSDIGVERGSSPGRYSSSGHGVEPSPRKAVQDIVSHQLLPPAKLRSDAPSPSPNRLREPFQYLPPTDTESADSAVVRMIEENARYSPSYRPSRHSPQVQRLNSPGSSPPSHWDDGFSSVSESQLKSKTTFFDQRVDDLVGNIIHQRLSPLEKVLGEIQDSLVHLSKSSEGRAVGRRPRSSGTLGPDSSDADDEDDVAHSSQVRPKSPLRERKYEQLKSSIGEIALAQQKSVSVAQFQELLTAVNGIKSTISHTPRAASPSSDLKKAIEEAVQKGTRGKSGPILSSTQAAAAEKSQLQIAGLESMLNIAETRAEDELKARRATEDALADNQRLFRQALQEAAQHRESMEATEAKLQEYHEERQHHLKDKAMLEGLHDGLERNASDLEEKNKALEGTLAEYRLSHDQWRADVNSLKHENKDLERKLITAEDIINSNQKEQNHIRSRFAKMQEDIASAARDESVDKLRWQNKADEHRKQFDLLTARLEAEARTRERLEIEIERLESQERESMKARLHVEQTQKANAHLHRLVEQTRSESHEHQNSAARLQRDLNVAKESHIMETHRIRSMMETDVKAAKTEVETIKVDLQGRITRLERHIEDAANGADDIKSKYGSMLSDASESHQTALRQTSQEHDKILQEHIRVHKQAIEQSRSQHQYALESALQERQRVEELLNDRANLANEKSSHLEDKVAHITERLEIAKSAAQAAAQAAQASKPAANVATVIADATGVSSAPEKVSPQALRESILVLQEQLQARESTIEDLESKISDIDTNAPAKLKEAEMEVAWLRELLSVRNDDLQDIVKNLSQPSFDRNTVRDAAIRLKTNMQMEQQEKEHAFSGGIPLPSLSNITNLTASPRALPMAAATAWTNWRRNRDSGYSNLGALAKGSVNETPSKLSSPRSVLSGLLTPPSTTLRTTPQLQATRSRPGSSAQHTVGMPSTPHQKPSLGDNYQEGPTTPPLMRKGSYDLDAAEAAVFGEDHDAVEANEDYQSADYDVARDEEPFGPRIGTFTAL
ncbi:uncharacterized protein KY384_002169 [Bacidia gigantensis]|uniref:uncharacterized protein n=1 Tax=Bacidia gigantensis TaxID=2732470 RepID=UPI001D040C04|nr:uncharacterized protein KY384_002169 [Bacidia gigantensis]KAG8533386.1 hypothetical protein KY384_002169 [Bacidia gigantensis]